MKPLYALMIAKDREIFKWKNEASDLKQKVKIKTEETKEEISDIQAILKKKNQKIKQLDGDIHRIVSAAHLTENIMHKYSDDEDEDY